MMVFSPSYMGGMIVLLLIAILCLPSYFAPAKSTSHCRVDNIAACQAEGLTNR